MNSITSVNEGYSLPYLNSTRTPPSMAQAAPLFAHRTRASFHSDMAIKMERHPFISLFNFLINV